MLTYDKIAQIEETAKATDQVTVLELCADWRELVKRCTEYRKIHEDDTRKIAAAIMALEELKTRNPLHNDYEDYLYEVAEWGLGNSEKPDPQKYGL